jgi:hypothetical protein
MDDDCPIDESLFFLPDGIASDDEDGVNDDGSLLSLGGLPLSSVSSLGGYERSQSLGYVTVRR